MEKFRKPLLFCGTNRYLFMKYILLFSSFFLIHLVQAQITSNIYWTQQTNLPSAEVIYYSNSRPLVWNDFKGVPDNNSRAAAVTASGFGYKADMKNSGNGGQINIGVYCYFTKQNSWVKPGRTLDHILTHEQNHFNISYIAANIFIEKLKELKLTPANLNTVLPRLYKECYDTLNKMQDDYDGQTKNGQLTEIQDKWNKYITQKLLEITK